MRLLSNARRIGLLSGLLILSALLIPGSTRADHTATIALAELKIESIAWSVTGVPPKAELSCAVTVKLVQDDSSTNTVVIVLVPPTTFVKTADASLGKCAVGPTASDPHGLVHGHVICRLGTLNPGTPPTGGPSTATIKIQANQLTKRWSKLGCSAFVYGDRPDSDHKVNFRPHTP